MRKHGGKVQGIDYASGVAWTIGVIEDNIGLWVEEDKCLTRQSRPTR